MGLSFSGPVSTETSWATSVSQTTLGSGYGTQITTTTSGAASILITALPSTPSTLATINTAFTSPGPAMLTAPAPVTSTFVPQIIPLTGVQRGTKCFPGLFIEPGGDLYNLTCGAQAAGNRIFAGIFNSVSSCAKRCSVLRANGTECDAVIFNQKIMGKRASVKRAPVNCYGLEDVTGADAKTLIDSAVHVLRIYTVVPGGVVLGPVVAQTLSKPPIAAPTNTFPDAESDTVKSTPNFYSPWGSPTATAAPIIVTFTLDTSRAIISSQPTSSPLSEPQVSSSTGPNPNTPRSPSLPTTTVLSAISSSSTLTSASTSSTLSAASSSSTRDLNPVCENIDYVTNGGFQSLINGAPSPWELFLDVVNPPSTSIQVQRILADPSDVSIAMSVELNPATGYTTASISQDIPAMCPGSNYTLSWSNQISVRNDTGTYCGVIMSLDDQSLTVLGGQSGDPLPLQYQNTQFPFQYGGAGGLDDDLIFTLYCQGTYGSANYTIDNISLIETTCPSPCF